MQRCVWQCRAQESAEQSFSGGNLEKQRQSPDRNQESQRRANSELKEGAMPPSGPYVPFLQRLAGLGAGEGAIRSIATERERTINDKLNSFILIKKDKKTKKTNFERPPCAILSSLLQRLSLTSGWLPSVFLWSNLLSSSRYQRLEGKNKEQSCALLMAANRVKLNVYLFHFISELLTIQSVTNHIVLTQH